MNQTGIFIMVSALVPEDEAPIIAAAVGSYLEAKFGTMHGVIDMFDPYEIDITDHFTLAHNSLTFDEEEV